MKVSKDVRNALMIIIVVSIIVFFSIPPPETGGPPPSPSDLAQFMFFSILDAVQFALGILTFYYAYRFRGSTEFSIIFLIFGLMLTIFVGIPHVQLHIRGLLPTLVIEWFFHLPTIIMWFVLVWAVYRVVQKT